jgi:rfaE bifunctional protein nucleotidyltransferase chain/domain
MSHRNVVGTGRIEAICAREHAAGRRVVHCHGCFDGLHIGHVRYLRAARAFGDTLIVSVTADEHVNKGPQRPVFSHPLRMEFLAELACVDWVTLSRSETALVVIEAIRPDVYVKGGEYEASAADPDTNVGAEAAAVRAHGGEVRFVHDELVLSSSALLRPRSASQPIADLSRSATLGLGQP